MTFTFNIGGIVFLLLSTGLLLKSNADESTNDISDESNSTIISSISKDIILLTTTTQPKRSTTKKDNSVLSSINTAPMLTSMLPSTPIIKSTIQKITATKPILINSTYVTKPSTSTTITTTPTTTTTTTTINTTTTTATTPTTRPTTTRHTTTTSITTKKPTTTMSFLHKTFAGHRIQSSVFRGYDPSIKPSLSKEILEIGLELEILSLVFYDDVEHFASIICLFKQNWTDSRLKWKPDEFDGIKNILRTRELIWKPDIMLRNSIQTPVFLHPHKLRINYQGSVTSIETIKYKVHCDSPHDKQSKCKLIFVASLSANTGPGGLKLKVLSPLVHAKFYRPHKDWELSRTTGEIVHRKHRYFTGDTDQAIFSISLKKRVKYVVVVKTNSSLRLVSTPAGGLIFLLVVMLYLY